MQEVEFFDTNFLKMSILYYMLLLFLLMPCAACARPYLTLHPDASFRLHSSKSSKPHSYMRAKSLTTKQDIH